MPHVPDPSGPALGEGYGAPCLLPSAADLVRHIYPYPASLEVDFFKASSYGAGTSSSGVVQLDSAFDLDSVRGKHLLLVGTCTGWWVAAQLTV